MPAGSWGKAVSLCSREHLLESQDCPEARQLAIELSPSSAKGSLDYRALSSPDLTLEIY